MAHASPGQHKFAPLYGKVRQPMESDAEGQSSVKRRYVLWQNTTRASPLVVLLARVESTIPYPRYRRFENYLAERFPPPLLPQLFTRRSVARGGLLASNFSSHSAGFASFSLSSRGTHTHTALRVLRELVFIGLRG